MCVCVCTYTRNILNGEPKKIFKNVEIDLIFAYAFLELYTHIAKSTDWIRTTGLKMDVESLSEVTS